MGGGNVNPGNRRRHQSHARLRILRGRNGGRSLWPIVSRTIPCIESIALSP